MILNRVIRESHILTVRLQLTLLAATGLVKAMAMRDGMVILSMLRILCTREFSEDEHQCSLHPSGLLLLSAPRHRPAHRGAMQIPARSQLLDATIPQTQCSHCQGIDIPNGTARPQTHYLIHNARCTKDVAYSIMAMYTASL